jgi:hypothetical protein
LTTLANGMLESRVTQRGPYLCPDLVRWDDRTVRLIALRLVIKLEERRTSDQVALKDAGRASARAASSRRKFDPHKWDTSPVVLNGVST